MEDPKSTDVTEASPSEAGAASAGPAPRRTATWLAGAALIVGLAVLALQIVTLQSANSARSEAVEAGASAQDAARSVGALRGEVSALADAVDELEADLESAAFTADVDSGSASTLETAQALPPYPQSGSDPAVQASLRLPSVTGDEYYSGQRITVSSDGESATVWLVWAHWCPHCQRELPELAEFWSTSAADYPHVNVVTVSSSIDESRGNPMVPYLDSSQFPFPVLVDESGSLAATFGTTAYPFWIVTGPDGRVLFRQPGAFGAGQLPGLFASVEEFATS